jgi:diguanylate cyclase (GGDEF)-like protein/PAS domain S-box-containing protein
MPKNAWRWYVLFASVCAAGYFPFFEWNGQPFFWSALGLSSVAAIGYGTWRNRPNAPLAWILLGCGVLTFITGDAMYKFSNQILHHTPSFPSIIDVFYLSMYPLLAAGLLRLERAHLPSGDPASVLDALTITIGLGLLSWIFLITPYFSAPGMGTLPRLTSIAYPLGDVLVLGMLARVWGAGGLRTTAGRLLALGATGTLVSDSIYGYVQLHGNWHDGNPVDFGWILFYLCWGAAALHPSMRELSEPRPPVPLRTTRKRLALLAGVSLIAPVVLITEATVSTHIDAGVIGACAAAMFVLVLARMAGLVRAHEQAVQREHVLRVTAGDLVTATSRAAILWSATSAVAELAADADVRVRLAEIDRAGRILLAVPDSPAEVSSRGEPTAGEPVGDALSAEVRAELGAHRPFSLEAGALPGLLDPSDDPRSRLHLFPIAAENTLVGAIALTSAASLPFELSNAVSTVIAQAELALDSDVLRESMHAQRSEARFQTLVQNASDIILIVRPDTTITYQTASVRRILGYGEHELEGQRLAAILHPDDYEQVLAVHNDIAARSGVSPTVEWRVRRKDGIWRDVEVVANNLLADPTVEGIVLTMRDVSDRKRLEDELKHQAFHDALSGLANRALFRDRLEHALARGARQVEPLAVLFIDLDDFKVVNDSLGHGVGDELLCAVGQRISESLRRGDTAARLGGDEFAILLEDSASSTEALDVAERIITELQPAFEVGDRLVRVQASIGIALSEDRSEDPADLLQAADVAMYAAKARGKGCFEVYRPALQRAMVDRLDRTAELQRALDNEEFELRYQPIVDLEQGGAIGVEALVRWRHPERGIILPKEFIPLAEETGLVIPLGRWVLEQACLQARRWRDAGRLGARLRMSVNISARHFQHHSLVDDVAHALEVSGIDPSSLVLEITETVLVQDSEAVISRMLEMKLLGVHFAIDDFGTGYSSLSYLQRFPIDILKVDKSFVDGVGAANDGALAEAVVHLGATLRLQTVAEGIERPDQMAGLRALGCAFGQGFLFAEPLDADQLDAFLESESLAGRGVIDRPVLPPRRDPAIEPTRS